MTEEDKMAKEEKLDLVKVMDEINKMLVEHKCSARDILHMARELETNAMVSVVFANIIQNAKANETVKKDKGLGKS